MIRLICQFTVYCHLYTIYIQQKFIHFFELSLIQRYYKQDGNSLTYNVSVKSRNLSMVLYLYYMYIQKLVIGYVGFYVELSFPIKKYV